jgi:CO/xanthine dehydrogenase Mo-binding subunit
MSKHTPKTIIDSHSDYVREGKDYNPAIPAGQEAPATPAYTYIGKKTPRLDGRKIVTGRAPFTHDIKLRGMIHGKILRSPHACAEILSIDLSEAKRMPGVKAVIALKKKGDRILYAGEQVAALAALNEAAAERALKKIMIDYNLQPHVVSEDKARQADAPQVHQRPNVQQFNDYKRGDVEAGFREADLVLEHTYSTPVEIHHPAETHSSIAKWDNDRLLIWDSTQAIHNVRNGVARSLGIPAGRVTVIKQYMGGGFGSKLGLNEQTVVAARLARDAGRPVKILLSRRDNALCVGNRPSSRQTYKGGVKKDGTLTALSFINYTSGGIGRGDRCATPVIDVYKCPNCLVEESTIYMNTGASRPTRAPGHVQGTFGLEGFLDEMAAALGMDPLELRRKNYSTKNEGDTGIPYSTKGLDQCYTLGARAIGWERRNRIPGEGEGRFRRGIGMASGIWSGAGVPGTLADVKLYPDGAVDVICGTQDIGCGTRTYMATVTAETLGIDPRDVTVKLGNSDYPWAPISGGSLTTPSVAPAVRSASLKALDYLKNSAAATMEIPIEDVTLGKKKFLSATDPDKSVTFRDLFRSLRRETVFHGERMGMPREYAFNTFGAHFSEVEVDTLTGRIRVLKHVAAHDSGQIINKLTAESQVIGAVTQALSTALFEQRITDDTTGNLVNPNLRDYKIATSMDIPEIIPIFVDIIDPRINILGTKGLGEPPRIPSSAAIANAVFNALGVHIREIPMTPDRVLAALNRKESDR